MQCCTHLILQRRHHFEGYIAVARSLSTTGTRTATAEGIVAPCHDGNLVHCVLLAIETCFSSESLLFLNNFALHQDALKDAKEALAIFRDLQLPECLELKGKDPYLHENSEATALCGLFLQGEATALLAVSRSCLDFDMQEAFQAALQASRRWWNSIVQRTSNTWDFCEMVH